jgi:hypothetical protein
VDSRAVLQPVGPHPPYVYWVRRLVPLAIVTLIVVLAVHGCSDGAAGGDAGLRQRADQQPLPGASTSPSASTTPASAAAAVACRPQDLRVAISSDSPTYPVGVDPKFTAVLRNAGPACRFPTALSTRTWRILSGVDEVWSTADCPRSSAGKSVRLEAGGQITYVLPWDRFRSTPGCAVAGAPAQPGTYRLYVTIDGARGRPVVFHLAG